MNDSCRLLVINHLLVSELDDRIFLQSCGSRPGCFSIERSLGRIAVAMGACIYDLIPKLRAFVTIPLASGEGKLRDEP